MSITYTVGNAAQVKPDGRTIPVIAHITNDHGGWGRGFVRALSLETPFPEANYRRNYTAGKVALGKNHYVLLANFPEDRGVVVNMCAQQGYKSQTNPHPLSYEALSQCLDNLGEWCDAQHIATHVQMPRIGCGLAGGSWSVVEPLIHQYLDDRATSVTVIDLV